MTALKLGLLGASGRMGQSLQKIIEAPDHLVWQATRDMPASLAALDQNLPDVVIDFSNPAAVTEWAPHLALRRLPLLVCTTGFAEDQLQQIQYSYAGKQVWSWCPNTSLGIFALRQALRAMAPWLKDFSVSLQESHHVHKKDAPSGTALALMETLRESGFALDPKEIVSERKGETIGVHTLTLKTPFEELVLKHEAHSRDLFAHGALIWARALHARRDELLLTQSFLTLEQLADMPE